GLAIGGDVGLQLLERAQPNRDEHTMTELADLGEGIGAVGGNADLRPGLLIGFWGQLDVVEAVIFALVGKRRLGPRLLQDVERSGATWISASHIASRPQRSAASTCSKETAKASSSVISAVR